MQDKDFVSYEYKTVTVKAKDQTRAMDVYEAFGWEVAGVSVSPVGTATLSLKRDRKQPHKQELNKLQRQAEETLGAIDGLKRSERMGAELFGYLFGIFAALVFGGGMCLCLLQTAVPALIGGAVLGALGLGLCIANYFIYGKIVAKKTKQVLPAIDQTEEQLADLLEKGNDLLKTEIL